MTRNDRYVVQHHGHLAPPPVEYRHNHDNPKRISSTFLIILVSLLFLAVFGGALVGGVVSGDPSNRFFITIIVASGVAIAIAAIVSLRYCCLQRAAKRQRQNNINVTKTNHNNRDVRQTFTQSADEDEEVGYFDSQGHFFQGQGPVQETIQEVKARKMLPGDISAMSPGSYAFDSYTQASSPAFARGNYKGAGYRIRQNHARPQDDYREGSSFDFASIVSSKKSFPPREDPPEDGTGSNLYSTGSMGRDPSAAKVTADGNILEDEDSDVGLNSPDAKSQSSRSVMSRYDVPDEADMDPEPVSASKKKRETGDNSQQEPTKSPGQRPHKDTLVPPPPPPPPPPSRSRSGRTSPSSRAGSSTPAGSEAGSTVSSLFLKPLANMFAKKKPASEAGSSDLSTTLKTVDGETKTAAGDKKPVTREGKPPMPGKKNSEEKRKGLDIIGGGSSTEDRYAPSTPGKNSTFSIPPPRRVPSTPGSEAPSEFRSMAGSSVVSNGVASSTFDPGARERAIQRTQRNTAALGAAFSDMPVYYEEDESAVTSAVNSVVNSVAPSEPTARSIGYDVLAPPGPLGMVVDTIEKGCVVHSLKKTSPMQGLINPGDLIVALDDQDVRKMDAASLTKLMANKSQQKERKFTLIPADQY